MYIYNVTIKVELHRADAWLEWMKAKHIPDVMATGYFTESRICRILDEDDFEGVTYAVQYTCNDLNDFLQYKALHAPALQKDAFDNFGSDFIAFRTLMEIL